MSFERNPTREEKRVKNPYASDTANTQLYVKVAKSGISALVTAIRRDDEQQDSLYAVPVV